MDNRGNYIKIFENGSNHLKIASLLANQQYYGSALSHIVLGIEELIKYQVYLNYLADKNIFTEKEIFGVFRNHKTKHNLINEFSSSLSAKSSEDFLNYIFKSATGQTLTENDLKIEKNRFKEIGSFLRTAYKEINLTEVERKEFINWLNNADNLKNKGFYVDNFNDKWSFPSDLTESEFKVAYKFANALLKQTEVIKDLDITDDEFIDFLNSEI